jgi:hypothetical protein
VEVDDCTGAAARDAAGEDRTVFSVFMNLSAGVAVGKGLPSSVAEGLLERDVLTHH